MSEIKQHAKCPLSWMMLVLASAIAISGWKHPVPKRPTSIEVVDQLEAIQVPFNQEVGQ